MTFKKKRKWEIADSAPFQNCRRQLNLNLKEPNKVRGGGRRCKKKNSSLRISDTFRARGKWVQTHAHAHEKETIMRWYISALENCHCQKKWHFIKKALLKVRRGVKADLFKREKYGVTNDLLKMRQGKKNVECLDGMCVRERDVLYEFVEGERERERWWECVCVCVYAAEKVRMCVFVGVT